MMEAKLQLWMLEEDVERKKMYETLTISILGFALCVEGGWLRVTFPRFTLAVNCQHFGYLHHSLPHTSSESEDLQHLQLS